MSSKSAADTAQRFEGLRLDKLRNIKYDWYSGGADGDVHQKEKGLGQQEQQQQQRRPPVQQGRLEREREGQLHAKRREQLELEATKQWQERLQQQQEEFELRQRQREQESQALSDQELQQPQQQQPQQQQQDLQLDKQGTCRPEVHAAAASVDPASAGLRQKPDAARAEQQSASPDAAAPATRPAEADAAPAVTPQGNQALPSVGAAGKHAGPIDHAPVLFLPGLDPNQAQGRKKLQHAAEWLLAHSPASLLLLYTGGLRLLPYSNGHLDLAARELPQSQGPVVVRMAAIRLPSGARAILLEGELLVTLQEGRTLVLLSFASGRVLGERLPLYKTSPGGKRALFAAPKMLDGHAVTLLPVRGLAAGTAFTMATALLRCNTDAQAEESGVAKAADAAPAVAAPPQVAAIPQQPAQSGLQHQTQGMGASQEHKSTFETASGDGEAATMGLTAGQQQQQSLSSDSAAAPAATQCSALAPEAQQAARDGQVASTAISAANAPAGAASNGGPVCQATEPESCEAAAAPTAAAAAASQAALPDSEQGRPAAAVNGAAIDRRAAGAAAAAAAAATVAAAAAAAAAATTGDGSRAAAGMLDGAAAAAAAAMPSGGPLQAAAHDQPPVCAADSVDSRSLLIQIPGLDIDQAAGKRKLQAALLWLSARYPVRPLIADAGSGQLFICENEVTSLVAAPPPNMRSLVVTRIAAIRLPSGARAILVEGNGLNPQASGGPLVLHSLPQGRILAESLAPLKISPQGKRALFAAPRLLTGSSVRLQLRRGSQLAAAFNMATDLLLPEGQHSNAHDSVRPKAMSLHRPSMSESSTSTFDLDPSDLGLGCRAAAGSEPQNWPLVKRAFSDPLGACGSDSLGSNESGQLADSGQLDKGDSRPCRQDKSTQSGEPGYEGDRGKSASDIPIQFT